MQVPNHVAVVLDGNRRWAVEHGSDTFGHAAGSKKFDEFLNWCLELGVPQISAWILSTENLNRSRKELNEIFEVTQKALQKWVNDGKILDKYEVKVQFLGDLKVLPPKVLKLMQKLMRRTAKYRKKIVNILVAYSGKFDLMHAIKKIALRALQSGQVRVAKKDVEKGLLFQQPIDLVIRTGGMSRLSNFAMWQTAYAEFFVTETLWPDFSKQEFIKSLKWYNSVKRKFGK